MNPEPLPIEGETPEIPLQPGENYRFHFDATKCIGCKCCVVACHEQNNNPPEVQWRQVGEIAGGEFPETKHFYISMSCNHCQDPSCLKGCPVDAYYKDKTTGVVLMKEDTCIGCQYCTWNCPYGAPQYNEERKMVTKCDMCHNRIAEGNRPACVEACPSEALTIERFNVEEWRENSTEANAPGVPDSSITQSTTRITLSKEKGIALNRIDDSRVKPEKPHYSLILLTVLTQLAVGGFSCLFALEWLDRFFHLHSFCESFLKIGHLTMLGTALLALHASVFHLGRPLYAIRAIKMWKRSWLSREVLFFTLFAGTAMLYSLLSWQTFLSVPLWVRSILGIGVISFGWVGVFCSAMIYRVPARPSWDNWCTPVAFFATAFLLGPFLVLMVLSWYLHEATLPLGEAVVTLKVAGTFLIASLLVAGFFQLGGIAVKLLNTMNQDEPELQHSAQLLTQRFRNLFLSRLGVLLMVLLATPLTLFTLTDLNRIESLEFAGSLSFFAVMALLSELAGRYLFFVTVVPKKRPGGYV
ncbi:MAG: dimethyl sulfoxide reductase anchor subunit [Deltaproteobacteria bacterium]|nr:dimethyl sulfoxide reductase anchor subunit [Deltaproteobacteria bacterium]